MEAEGFNSSIMDFSNIDTDLINQFLDYTIARDLWKGIEILLNSGRDEL